MASWSEVLEALRAARFQIETRRHGATHVLHHLASLTQRAQLRMSRLHKTDVMRAHPHPFYCSFSNKCHDCARPDHLTQ